MLACQQLLWCLLLVMDLKCFTQAHCFKTTSCHVQRTAFKPLCGMTWIITMDASLFWFLRLSCFLKHSLENKIWVNPSTTRPPPKCTLHPQFVKTTDSAMNRLQPRPTAAESRQTNMWLLSLFLTLLSWKYDMTEQTEKCLQQFSKPQSDVHFCVTRSHLIS